MSLRPPAAALLIAIGLLGFAGVQRGASIGAEVAALGPAPTVAPAPAVTPPPVAAASEAPTRPSPVPVATEKPAVSLHGPRDQKLVALTFDDGWNGTNVQAIYATLVRMRAPATFFPVGRAVVRHPELWRTMAAAGFPIGNHSWNHDDLAKMTVAKATADITRATRAIEGVTGMPLFPGVRPPYGTYDKGVIKAAGAAGMARIVLWDIDTRDWSGVSAKKVVRAATHVKPGSIVVLHTDKANTVKALPGIIDGLRSRGYTLVTVGQLLGIPGDVPVFPANPASRAEHR